MKKLAFLFPGQGSQTVGMMQYLIESEALARGLFAAADQALGESLSALIARGPEEVLKETANAQPAILTASVAVGRVLAQRGIAPSVMAGHSLGEYSALVLGGAIRFEDAVRLVRLRGKFMQEAVPMGAGTMSAVLGAEDSMVEEVCKEISAQGKVVEPANYNCPGQLVISGTVEGVEAAVEALTARGVKRCIPLKVSAPFHCSLLRPAAVRLKQELDRIEVHKLKVPVIANVDCSVLSDPEAIRRRLVEQVYSPVRWSQSLALIAKEMSPEAVIEVGPGQVVTGHMRKVAPELPRFTTDSAEALRSALSLAS